MQVIPRVPSIPPEVEAKRAEIAALCRRFGVVRLDLFGSAAIGRVDPLSCDDDFLVTWLEGYDFGTWYGRSQDLHQELGRIMGSQVDPVSLDTVRRPSIRSGIERSRAMLFHG